MVVPPRAGRDYAEAGLELTYRKVHDYVLALSEAYDHAGYGGGHRVALLLDSRPDMILHLFALNRLGASIVPINPDYRHEETLYVLNHSEADLIVVLPRHLARIVSVCDNMEAAPAVVLLDDVMKNVPAPRRLKVASIPSLETEAAILYTSGTTAAPKGCIAENAYALYSAERYANAGGVVAIREGRERLFNPLPLFYVNSLIITTSTMITTGGCSIYPDRFHVKTWWDDIAATRPTMVQHLGIVMPALYSLAPSKQERLHKIRVAVGAGVEPTMHRKYEERFGFPIVEVWGMTEVAIGSMAFSEPRNIETRSVGFPLEGMEFRIVDDEDQTLGPDQVGELVVRRSGPDPRLGLVRSYLKDQPATDAAWRGGWFHTGDLLQQNQDGSYRFVDRKKDIIRRSGQNIAASEIEEVLVEHPKVLRVACIAAPDEMREEEVLACIILKPGVEPSYEIACDIAAFTVGRLAYFKMPGWVAFFDSFPLTVSQKLQKRALFAAGQDPRKCKNVHDVLSIKQGAREAS
jgi:crotonobetaine/carnitine-CoA ligase